MSDIAEIGAYTVGLYKAATRLSGATDTCFIVACDIEDAVEQVREAYADANVLYVQSLERLAGVVFVSKEAKDILLEALA
jgi:hypothetical protein